MQSKSLVGSAFNGLSRLWRSPDEGGSATHRLPGMTDEATGLENRRALREDNIRILSAAEAHHRIVVVAVIELPDADDASLAALGQAVLSAISSDVRVARNTPTTLACIASFDRIVPDAVDHLVRDFAAIDHPALRRAAIGFARGDRDGGSLDTLIEAASIAASEAALSTHQTMWFAREMVSRRDAHDNVVRALPAAIADGAVIPYFESFVDLATGDLLGFEVLARWNHPTRGVVSPQEFIAIAEESDAIGDLSLSVMQQALVAARDWHRSLFLSFNLSPVQLRDPWLSQKIIRLLTETAFPASRLQIELTEHALFDPDGIASSIVGTLKEQGVRIALDDFGAGVSSLSHLRALPFDRIKIDRSIVSRIVEDGERAAIVAAIVSVGEHLNLPISAEGVENEKVAERLRATGCSTGQGYLYGRPMSIIQTRRLLAEKRLIEFGDPDPTNLRLAG